MATSTQTVTASRDSQAEGNAARWQRLERLANVMDAAVQVPGTKFHVGLDSLVGLIPGIGDLATAAVSAYIIAEGARMGASKPMIARMLVNVGIDTFIGAVPIVGDLFDAGFKSNVKNVELLRRLK